MDAGDQTLYLVFRLAEFGMEGGLSALKITGKGAANIASTLAHLGKNATKVLFREKRVKSLLKHGDIDTTVLTIKETDKVKVEELLKRNKVTGFMVKPPSRLLRKKEKIADERQNEEPTINIFIRSTDANKASAVLGELAVLVGQLETTSHVPNIEQATDIRTWEPVDQNVLLDIEEVGEEKTMSQEDEEVSLNWSAAIDKVTRKNEDAEWDAYESQTLSFGVMEGEVADDPFARRATRASEQKQEELPTKDDRQEKNLASGQKIGRLGNGPTSQILIKESNPSSDTSKTENRIDSGEKKPGVMDVMNEIKEKRHKSAEKKAPSQVIDKAKER